MSNRIEKKSILAQARDATRIYGESVILQRALPDYRDGLKPVQRRILWTMRELGLHHKGAYKKSARTVGSVIGNYHPHGDASCYDALVNLVSQVPVPLVDGQGNFGDHIDPAAAYRYCVTGDTLINTEHGLVRIDKIPHLLGKEPQRRLHISLSVESRDGVEVATHWLDSGVRDVYEVRSSLGTIKATENEPILVLNDALEFEWRTVLNLEEGDIVCFKKAPTVTSGLMGGGKLNPPPEPTEKQMRSGYRVSAVPTHMSTDFALWLGLVIAGGSIDKASVRFISDDPELVRLYGNLSESLFPDAGTVIYRREPNPCEWGKNLHWTVSTYSTHVLHFLYVNGIPSVGDRFNHMPSCILQASDQEVIAFLRGAFEGDGSSAAAHNVIQYSSSSDALLCGMQTLMLTRFGLPFKMAFGEEFLDETDRPGAIFLRGRREVGDFYKRIGFIPCCTKNDIREWSLASVAGGLDIQPHDFRSASVERLHGIIDSDYYLCDVRSIKKLGKEPTYDLTVPGSHSYTANGMVIHNTESRLSKFSDTFMLDSEYLQITPMVPNFSDDRKEPVFLPAKLPTLFLNGAEGIAVGLSTNIPSFTLDSVKRCASFAIRGTLTPSRMAKTLLFSFRYGGSTFEDDTGLLDVCKTGRGAVEFTPDIEVDYTRQKICITSMAPRLNLIKSRKAGEKVTKRGMTVLESISEIPGVTTILDGTGSDSSKSKRRKQPRKEIRYIINTARNVSKKAFKGIVEQVEDIIVTKSHFNIAVTETHDDGSAEFWQVSLFEVMDSWAKWRIAFEREFIKHKISKISVKISQLRLVILALKNLDIISKSWRVRDPVAYLRRELRVTEKGANQILDFKVRQLSRMERSSVISKIKELKEDQAALKADYDAPQDRIIRDIRSIAL